MHPLLEEQLRAVFGALAAVPVELRELCLRVDAAYRAFDAERGDGAALGAAGKPAHPAGSSEANAAASLEEDLRVARRMEIVARFSAGVAHDFNNLLTTISGNAALALSEAELPARLRARIEEISRAAVRAGRLTHQLLAYSRQQVLQPSVLDLNERIRELERPLRRLLGNDVQLALKLSSRLGSIRADPSQLEEAVASLAANAREAMPKGGSVVISTANVHLDGSEGGGGFAVQPGDYIRLSLADTGEGMDDATRERVLEPFFSTKKKGQGAGLGLSTVYGSIKQSGGYIWIDSAVGRGCTVHLYWPQVESETAVAAEPEPIAAVEVPTILLAEDEPAIRMLILAILADSGYRVLPAASGAEALDLGRRQSERIHLLITDVMMPGMSGPELARRLVEVHPEAKLLFMSGYADRAAGGGALADPSLTFLEKPFLPAELVAKVRALVGPV